MSVASLLRRPGVWMRARVSSSWIVLALLAPPCQERNPDFDGASADTGGASTTAMPGESASTSDVSGTAGSDTAGVPTTSGPPGGGGTTDLPSGSSSDGSQESGSSSGGCAATMCGDTCVDVMTDPDHCGECWNGCHPVQEVCEMGICVNG